MSAQCTLPGRKYIQTVIDCKSLRMCWYRHLPAYHPLAEVPSGNCLSSAQKKTLILKDNQLLFFQRVKWAIMLLHSPTLETVTNCHACYWVVTVLYIVTQLCGHLQLQLTVNTTHKYHLPLKLFHNGRFDENFCSFHIIDFLSVSELIGIWTIEPRGRWFLNHSWALLDSHHRCVMALFQAPGAPP